MNPDEQNSLQPSNDPSVGAINPSVQPDSVNIETASPTPTVIEPNANPDVVAAAPQTTEITTATSLAPADTTPSGIGPNEAPQMTAPPEQSQSMATPGVATQVSSPVSPAPSPGVGQVPVAGSQKNTLPIVLIGIGVVLIITILGLVFL